MLPLLTLGLGHIFSKGFNMNKGHCVVSELTSFSRQFIETHEHKLFNAVMPDQLQENSIGVGFDSPIW